MTYEVGIIGAGPSGLALARQLKAAGIAFRIHEKHNQIGGLWDINNPGSPMYESAHFISSKSQSGFYQFPMPDSYPDYPHRRLILEYIQNFASQFRLEKYIDYRSHITRAEPEDEGWRVTDSSGKSWHYRYLVCASGVNWEPQWPTFSGQFTGEILHAVNYQTSDIFVGKRVLVVGAGNSGCDIACDAAQRADNAFISVRRGYHFIPKHIMGVPTDVYEAKTPWLPMKIKQILFPKLLKYIARAPDQYGLPSPDHKLFESHPIMNDQLLHYLAHGDIHAKPNIARFNGDSVLFTDGTEAVIDLIVYATGYKNAVAYIDSKYLPQVNNRTDLYLNVFSRQQQNLFAIGFLETNSGAFSMFDHMSNLVVNYIENDMAKSKSANRFASFIQSDTPNLTGGISYLKSQRHGNYVNKRAYLHYINKINRTLGWPNLHDKHFLQEGE